MGKTKNRLSESIFYQSLCFLMQKTSIADYLILDLLRDFSILKQVWLTGSIQNDWMLRVNGQERV